MKTFIHIIIGFMIFSSNYSHSQIDKKIIGKLVLEPGTVLELNAVSGGVTASWRGFPHCVPRSEAGNYFYTLPAGFIILETRWVEQSKSNGSYGISTFAKDTKIISKQEIKEIQDDLSNYDFKVSDENTTAKIQAYINNKLSEYSSYLNEIEANKNTIQLNLNAKAHGGCHDQKRGWIQGYVIATVLYIGSDKEAIKIKLIKEVEGFTSFLAGE
jgi:hypothetical protein